MLAVTVAGRLADSRGRGDGGARRGGTVRIALVAMSGIRAHREELTRLGMTLPGFLGRGKALASLPSLGLLTLAGLTPDRHEVTYHEVANLRDLDRLPDCDLAAVSTFTAQVKDAYALAARFRAQGSRTVLGGLHATAMPEEALRHVDVFLPNETELCAIAGMPDVPAALARMAERVALVAVKLGARGASARRGNRTIHADPLAIEVVDTTGAGDSFDAGFVYGQLAGWELDRSLRLACVCGALSTRAAGGIAAQATLDEALALL